MGGPYRVCPIQANSTERNASGASYCGRCPALAVTWNAASALPSAIGRLHAGPQMKSCSPLERQVAGHAVVGSSHRRRGASTPGRVDEVAAGAVSHQRHIRPREVCPESGAPLEPHEVLARPDGRHSMARPPVSVQRLASSICARSFIASASPTRRRESFAVTCSSPVPSVASDEYRCWGLPRSPPGATAGASSYRTGVERLGRGYPGGAGIRR